MATTGKTLNHLIKKFMWTFASYDQKDEAYSDRNVFPIKCITKMEKLNV